MSNMAEPPPTYLRDSALSHRSSSGIVVAVTVAHAGRGLMGLMFAHSWCASASGGWFGDARRVVEN